MSKEYHYQCIGCGKVVVKAEPVEPFRHWLCRKRLFPFFYRDWQAVGVIFKAQGYTKNSLSKKNKRHWR